MSVSEMKEKLNKLEELKFELELLVSSVNDKTREIKYINTPSDIYIDIETKADANGIDVTYEVDQVRQAVNTLESAVYELVTPFEDKLRDVELEHDDLECDIYEEVHC